MQNPTFPSRLPFSAFLVYPNKAAILHASDPAAAERAKSTILALKQDKVEPTHNRSYIDIAAHALATRRPPAVMQFFSGDLTLVPMPRSAPLVKNAVWASRRIANALVENNLGTRVVSCLYRDRVTPKSSYCGPGARPSPREHFQTMAVTSFPRPEGRVVLVDDVITKGSTFLGAAARLLAHFPDIEIVAAFAIAHTVSVFTAVAVPVCGEITCFGPGDDASRSPRG